MQEHESWFLETDLPLFGLPPTYSGLRMVGDSERSFEQEGRASRELTREYYGLMHGDPLSSSSPRLQTITSRGQPLQVSWLLEAEERELARVGSPHSLVQTTVLLDGEVTSFGGLQGIECWAIQAPLGDCLLSLVGVRSSLDDLSLVRIRNVDDYIQGRHRYLRARHPNVW